MWTKTTQAVRQLVNRTRNASAIREMNADTLRSFLIVLAITILSFEATDLFYKVISFPLLSHAAIVKSNGSTPAGKDNHQRGAIQDYDIITGRNLFLSTLKPAGGNQSDGGLFDSDDKTLDFDLKGTVACDSSFGFIIVEERGTRKQKLYRLGNKIGSDKLVKITRNSATFNNGLRDTTLKIKETMEGPLLPNTPGSGRGGSGRNITLNRRTVNENMTNLSAIMNQAVLRPSMNRGVQDGYMISNIVQNSIYEKAGLQNGDIIIDVNNNRMQNANEIMQVMNSMQSGNNMTLNIKRNGRNETINYSFD